MGEVRKDRIRVIIREGRNLSRQGEGTRMGKVVKRRRKRE